MKKQLLFNIWILFNLITFGVSIEFKDLTSEQQQFITYYADAYARLTCTFDPAEVPLEQYFETNRKEIEEYTNIKNSIHEKLRFNSKLPYSEHDTFKIFDTEVKKIVAKEFKNNPTAKPQTFKLFKTWWAIRLINGPERDLGKNIPDDHVLRGVYCLEFQNNNQIPEKQIKEALTIVRSSYFKKDLKNKRDGEYLPDKYVQYGEAVERNGGKRPTTYATHHIIPAANLITFFNIYYKNKRLLGNELVNKGIYDWYMVDEHNDRKSMIMNYKNLFSLVQDNPAGLPNLQKDDAYKKFISKIAITPLGLSFRGPIGIKRFQDPGSKFEDKCEIIVGKEYFKKVKKLYEQIQEFNNENKVNLTPEEIDEKASKIYDRIFNIHLDGGKEFFHYNPNHWIWVENKQKSGWDIGLNPSQWVLIKSNSLVNAEWRLKQFAQVSYCEAAEAEISNVANMYVMARGRQNVDPSQEPDVVIVPLDANRAGPSRQNVDPMGVQDPDVAFAGLVDRLTLRDRYNVHGSEFRKKRTSNFIESFTESLEAMCSKETTTTEKSKEFWCSPFYLRINPMNYIYCKLTGRHDLHFF
jgi:hypothetical protein